jgi:hypothetical protein
MRTLLLIVCFVAALMLESPCSGFGQDALPSSPEETKLHGLGPDPTAAPRYQFHTRKVPKARIEGGTRGSNSNEPEVIPLVPDHVGLTIASQPVLYWYLSKPTIAPIIFVLVDTRSIQVIHDATFAQQPQSGVQSVRLKDFGLSLEPDVQYRWYLNVVLDPNSPSRDIVSGGMIERIPSEYLSHLPATSDIDALRFYAEAGLWYDALASISDLISTAPEDRLLRKHRASLLQQVGLQEVAGWDLRQAGKD